MLEGNKEGLVSAAGGKQVFGGYITLERKNIAFKESNQFQMDRKLGFKCSNIPTLNI